MQLKESTQTTRLNARVSTHGHGQASKCYEVEIPRLIVQMMQQFPSESVSGTMLSRQSK